MKKILVVQSSARQEGSLSREYANNLVAQLQAKYPGSWVVTRDLGAEAVPHLDATLLGGWMKPAEEQTDAELKDAAIIIEKRESEIVDLKYNLAITEEKLDSALRDSERHEREAFKLQTKLDEMRGVESLIMRVEALEERASNETAGKKL